MASMRSLFVFTSILASVYAAPYFTRDTPDAPALPSSALPPPTDLNLKAIILGVGHQNYTCNPATGTYGTNVALADLFDATQYLSCHKDEVDTISERRLKQYRLTGQSALLSDYNPILKLVGKHYFKATTPNATPFFDLYGLGLALEAKKAGDVLAPDSANDIDWLYLVDNGKGESNGLKAVYRVETAGGKPPASCSGTEQAYVPYVAQYWFYN